MDRATCSPSQTMGARRRGAEIALFHRRVTVASLAAVAVTLVALLLLLLGSGEVWASE